MEWSGVWWGGVDFRDTLSVVGWSVVWWVAFFAPSAMSTTASTRPESHPINASTLCIHVYVYIYNIYDIYKYIYLYNIYIIYISKTPVNAIAGFAKPRGMLLKFFACKPEEWQAQI